MSRTRVNSRDIRDGSITVDDLNTTTINKSVITKIQAGANISIQSTGIDDGTGVVTISSSGSGSSSFTHFSSGGSDQLSVDNSFTCASSGGSDVL